MRIRFSVGGFVPDGVEVEVGEELGYFVEALCDLDPLSVFMVLLGLDRFQFLDLGREPELLLLERLSSDTTSASMFDGRSRHVSIGSSIGASGVRNGNSGEL